jgi:hypothetical protein
MFKVTLEKEIAIRKGGSNVRRRTVTLADGSTEVMVFGRKPVFMETVPPEVANDPHLIVVEAPSPAGHPRLDAAILDSLDYEGLMKLAKDLGIAARGKKAELRERLEEELAARAAAEGKA